MDSSKPVVTQMTLVKSVGHKTKHRDKNGTRDEGGEGQWVGEPGEREG